MIDDLIEIAGAAAVDIATDKAARRHRWVRVAGIVGGLLLLAALIAVLYVTIQYS